MTNTTSRQQLPLAYDFVYYACAVAFSVYMFYYYWTSAGGPMVLAVTMVPLIFVLFTMQALRQDEFYPKLPVIANYVIAAAYCAFALYCAYYMRVNYRALGEERAGAFDPQDIIVGGLMALLILEYARKRHLPLFILNLILIFYAVYGYLVPGMFYHAGLIPVGCDARRCRKGRNVNFKTQTHSWHVAAHRACRGGGF